MMLSQKAYAAKNGVAPKTVKSWYEKNYLPGATRNECTGEYAIPADTPVPYHGKGLNKVTTISTLMIKLLEAAESAQSVFASMFPGISEAVFEKTLNGLIQEHNVDLIKTEFSTYLHITADGVITKRQLMATPEKHKKELNSFLFGTTSGVLGTLICDAIHYIVAHPEVADSVNQFLLTMFNR